MRDKLHAAIEPGCRQDHFGDRLAQGVSQPHVRRAALYEQDDALRFGLIDRERCHVSVAHAVDLMLDRPLEVLRPDVAAIDENEILAAAGDHQRLAYEIADVTCVEPTVGLWQVAHPIALNKELPAAIVCEGTCCPFNTTPPAGGGARVRMKLANAETSSRTAAPADPGLFASSG